MRNKQNQSLNANSNYQCVAYNRLFLNTRLKREQTSLHQISTSFEHANQKHSKSKARDKQSIKNKSNIINTSEKHNFQKNNQCAKSNEISQNNSAVKHDFPKNRQENKTFRKLQLAQRETNIPRSFTISIDQSKLFEDRPHYSQNLKPKVQPTNRKLYTFCSQGIKQKQQKQKQNNAHQKETKQTEQCIDKYISQQQNSSAIIIKEEQLKRFTQKFARERIEYQESLVAYINQINKLKTKYNQLQMQKKQQAQKYNYQRLQCKYLQQQIQALKKELKAQAIKNKQIMRQFQVSLQAKDMKMVELQKLLGQRQSKINEILQQLSRRQRQIQKIQSQNIYSKMILPISNISHQILSINSQVYNQSPLNISKSKQLLEEIDELRNQCTKYQSQQMQTNKSIQFLRIQNEHLSRQLELEKQTVLALKQQIGRLQPMQQYSSIKMQQESIISNKQNFEVLHQQIFDLISQNTTLASSKQTLQRSLKVSSEMILHLKQEINTLRNKYENQINKQLNITQKGHEITLEHVKTIIRIMMKDQLLLEDKLIKDSQCLNFKPIIQNQNFKKYYEQGYQSVRQNSKTAQKHFKTEQYSPIQDNQQSNFKSYTESSRLKVYNKVNPFHSYLHLQNKINF